MFLVLLGVKQESKSPDTQSDCRLALVTFPKKYAWHHRLKILSLKYGENSATIASSGPVAKVSELAATDQATCERLFVQCALNCGMSGWMKQEGSLSSILFQLWEHRLDAATWEHGSNRRDLLEGLARVSCCYISCTLLCERHACCCCVWVALPPRKG